MSEDLPDFVAPVENGEEPYDLRHVQMDLASLQYKVDSLTTGMAQTYSGVQWLMQMLSGVQQMALSMPGFMGKKVRKMAEQMGDAPVEGNNNG